jgi:hypothetical protein
VADAEEVDSWINDIIRDHGRLDGAANVAGMASGEGQVTEAIVRAKNWSGHDIPSQPNNNVSFRS